MPSTEHLRETPGDDGDGVHVKIESFFDVCRSRGLTGEQGVLIPRRNQKGLMLRRDVVEAIREGKFAIHALDSVEEGIELLTGVPAGEMDAHGKYPPSTVFGAVQAKLARYRESLVALAPR